MYPETNREERNKIQTKDQSEESIIQMKVGDRVICIKKPTQYANGLETGEIYTVSDVSRSVYLTKKEAIMVEGGCHGSWYIVEGRFELADKTWLEVAELNGT